jgi:hypothetical protein
MSKKLKCIFCKAKLAYYVQLNLYYCDNLPKNCPDKFHLKFNKNNELIFYNIQINFTNSYKKQVLEYALEANSVESYTRLEYNHSEILINQFILPLDISIEGFEVLKNKIIKLKEFQ